MSIPIVLMFIIGFNLQSGIFIVGPLLPDLVRDLAISGTTAGALVAIPPFMMGLGAIPGAALANRLGPGRTIAIGMAVIGVTGALRGLAPSWPVMLLLTILFGGGIGFMQPAGPAYIRQRFGAQIGSTTSVYTFGLVTGIIIASSLAGPVIAPLAGGWRGAFLFWGALAVVAAVLWLTAAKDSSAEARPTDDAIRQESATWSPWRQRVVWLAAGLYASQGIVFFLLGSWLPAVYEEAGYSTGAIGARMLVLTAASLPAILILPAWAARSGSLRLPLIVSAALTLVGAIGFFTATSAAAVDWLWPLLAGFGVGGILVLVLVFAAEVAPPGKTGETAGMVLAVGYTTTALGPFLAGLIRDLSGGFQSALLVLPVVAFAMLLLSLAMPRLDQRAAAPLQAE
ncbi:MAG: MFS transporter [Thermomicrobiales bacterium]|nr:MFS transporter [Thermomicrobiales bacterium]